MGTGNLMRPGLKGGVHKHQKSLYARGRHAADIIVAKITNAITLHCLGDSHTRMFEHVARRRFWWHTRFQFCVVKGATTTGLANPISKTRAYPIFQQYLGGINASDHLLFCMGEVDCGFVIWYRAQKYGDSVQAQMELAVRNYTQFVDQCIARGFKNIILCSAPLPTILDDQEWGEVATSRKEVKTSLRARTDLTRAFNQQIKAYCQLNGLQYLDYESETLDPETQVVSDAFRNQDHLDHHLDPQALSDVIIPKLMQMNYW
jgi:hypothetical protein